MSDPRSRRSVLRAGFLALGSCVAGCIRGTPSETTPGASSSSPTTEPTAEPTAEGTTATSETDRRGTPSSPPSTTTARSLPYDAPPPGECRALDPPVPTPTAEGLEPQEYPTYPASITEEAARSFASEYERVYQFNSFVAEDFIRGTDDILIVHGVPNWAMREEDRGFVVGVDGRLSSGDLQQPEDWTGTPAPHLDAPFGAWYYLTDRFALRNEVRTLEGSQSPNLESASTIVCE